MTQLDASESARGPGQHSIALANVVWILLPLAGLALFLFRNTHESLWLDEVYSMAASSPTLNLVDFWSVATRDTHSPFYYCLLWIFRQLFGPSPLVARTFSALGAFGLLLLGAWPLRRALGDKAALIFMALVVGTPAYVAWAQDIRMYSWAVCFVMGMAVYMHLAIRDGGRVDWLKASIFMCASMYIHPFGLMAAFFVGLYSLIYVVRSKRQRLPACLASIGLATLVFLPWSYAFFERAHTVAGGFWIPPVIPRVIGKVFAYPFGLKFITPGRSYGISLLVYLVAGSGLLVALRKSERVSLAVVCLLSFISSISLAILISWLVRPILIGRYTIPLVGLLLAAAAFGLAQLRRWVLLLVGIVFLVSEAPLLTAIYRDRFNGPMQEVTTYLEANLQPGDVIIHIDRNTLLTFAYYLPLHTQLIYPGPGSKKFATATLLFPNVRILTDLNELDAGKQGTWLAVRCTSDNLKAYEAVVAHYGLMPYREMVCGRKLPTTNIDYGSARVFSLPRSWYAIIVDKIP